MRRQDSQDEAGEEIESLLLADEKSHDQSGLLPNHVTKSPDHMPHCNDSSLVLVNRILESPRKQYSLARSPDKWLGKSYSDADLRSMEKCTVTENKLALQGSIRKTTSKDTGSFINHEKGAVTLSGSLATDAFSTIANHNPHSEILELKDLSQDAIIAKQTKSVGENSNGRTNGDGKTKMTKNRNKQGAKFRRQMSDTTSGSPSLSSSSKGSSSISSLQGAAALRDTCSPSKTSHQCGTSHTGGTSRPGGSNENLSKNSNSNGNVDATGDLLDKTNSMDISSPKASFPKSSKPASAHERQARIQILQRELARIQRELKSLGELEVEVSYV